MATKKATQKTSKKYRITTICGNAGGPVTAENVGLKFTCPNCGTNLEVSGDFKKLEVGNENPPGHSLRSVKEVGNASTSLSPKSLS